MADDPVVEVDDTGDEDSADDPGTDADDPIEDAAPGCNRTGIVAAEGQSLVIEAVNFDDDIVIIRNLGSERFVFFPDADRGQPNWRIHVESPPTAANLPANFPIEPGASVRIHLRADGDNDSSNIYLSWTAQGADLTPFEDGDGSKAALLCPHDGYSNPDAHVAYVRWGGDETFDNSLTFRDEAAAAGLWIGNDVGDFIYVDAGSHGIAITEGGDVTDPAD